MTVKSSTGSESNTTDVQLQNVNESCHRGIYSGSGFDLLSLLVTIHNRPNPEIDLGPIDMNCAFVVSDARRADSPIIYTSHQFENLTGYASSEIIGRNCRFLQAPNAQVSRNSKRKYTDNSAVFNIRENTLKDGTFGVNYSYNSIPRNPQIRYSLNNLNLIEHKSENNVQSYISSKILRLPLRKETFELWVKMLVNNIDDFVLVLNTKCYVMYTTESSSNFLNYNIDEILGHNFSKFCHPSDLTQFIADSKQISKSRKFCNIFRLFHKNKGYIWVEGCASFIKRNKNYIVLTCRNYPMQSLSSDILTNSTSLDREFWIKITYDGHILFISSSGFSITGYDDEIIGTLLYDYINYEKSVSLTRALKQASEGFLVNLSFLFKHKNDNMLSVKTIFHPSTNYDIRTNSFVTCQIKLCESSLKTSKSDSSSNSDPSIIATQNSKDNDNIFDFLNPNNNITWQKEYQKLVLLNQNLKNQIEEAEIFFNRKLPNSLKCERCLNKKDFRWKTNNSNPSIICNRCGIIIRILKDE